MAPFYPINYLRNVALNYSLTQYTLILDVDLVPSIDAYNNCIKMVSFLENKSINLDVSQFSSKDTAEVDNNNQFQKVQNNSKTSNENRMPQSIITSDVNPNDKEFLTCKGPEHCAFVLPAFEATCGIDAYAFPANKSQLARQYFSERSVTAFRSTVWPQGHSPTNYARWFKSSQSYRVRWRPDYEPYVLLKVKNITNDDLFANFTAFHIPPAEIMFDQHFLGLGWNKVAFTILLDSLGYLNLLKMLQNKINNT